MFFGYANIAYNISSNWTVNPSPIKVCTNSSCWMYSGAYFLGLPTSRTLSLQVCEMINWLTSYFAPNRSNFASNFQVTFFANMSSKMVQILGKYFRYLWQFSGTILYPISHLFLMISLRYVTILPNTQIFSALRSTYISPCILIFFFIQFLIVFLKTEIFSALRSTYIYR